jgi:hypothetical protein
MVLKNPFYVISVLKCPEIIQWLRERVVFFHPDGRVSERVGGHWGKSMSEL